LGVSEDQVIALFIPDVEEKVRKSAGREPGFEAWVDGYRETNFGQEHRRFLLAAVGTAPGWVPNWPSIEIGIVDLDRKKLLWKTEEARGELEGTFAFISLENRGPLAFRYRIYYETDYGFDQVTEYWYQAVPAERGELGCRRIWSAILKTENSAARGGHRESSRGTVSHRPGQSTWSYTVRRFLEKGKRVTILRSERWGLRHGEAVRFSERVSRIDNGKAPAFPFDLDQRSIRWRVVADHGDLGAISPSGENSVTKESDSPFGDVVVLRGSDAAVRRTLIPENDEGYGCAVESLGRTVDGDRVFAVVALGSERALLSFSLSGEPDYWEKTLVDTEARWNDGFVLEPEKQTAKKAVKK
jgi:hypothetical protein